MNKLILVLSIMMSSCTTPVEPPTLGHKDIRYSFANDFGIKMDGITPESAKTQFRIAAAKWSSVSGVNMVEVKLGGIMIYGRPLLGNVLGLTNYQMGIVLMDTSNRKWNKLLFYKVALHELGHALGLPHIMHDRSIMYPSITNQYNLSSFDIARIQSIYGENK